MIRREWVWIGVVTLLGAGLRLKGLANLGLEHFDEGVYAILGLRLFVDGLPEGLDPASARYAPPGFPLLVSWSFDLFGVADSSALLNSILAGTLTIPAVGWLGRRLFGPGGGASASSLAALSGPHAVFCRTALTDPTFLLAWILALGWGMRFLERPGARRGVVFGLLAGAAWLLKYNGWMVVAIVALAALIGAFRRGEARQRSRGALAWGVLPALVAVACYAPWALFVERSIGYGELLAHHRSYLDGPLWWWSNWRQQMAQTIALAGRTFGPGFFWAGLAVATAWAGAAVSQGPWLLGSVRRPVIRLVVGTALGIAALALPANTTWWVALAALPWLLMSDRPALRALGLWWLIMTLSTPLYRPYARLWLPTLAASWLITAGVLSGVLRRLGQPAGPDAEARRLRDRLRSGLADLKSGVGCRRLLALGIVLAAFGPWLQPARIRPVLPLLGPSDGIRQMKRRLVERFATEPDPPILDIHGRPGFSFYMWTDLDRAPDFRIFQTLEGLAADMGPDTVAIVDGWLGVDGRAVAERLEAAGAPLVEAIPLEASAPTRLDIRPDSVYRRRDSETAADPLSDPAHIWIFRYRAEPNDEPPGLSNGAER